MQVLSWLRLSTDDSIMGGRAVQLGAPASNPDGAQQCTRPAVGSSLAGRRPLLLF
jgi:hypothetical protein